MDAQQVVGQGVRDERAGAWTRFDVAFGKQLVERSGNSVAGDGKVGRERAG